MSCPSSNDQTQAIGARHAAMVWPPFHFIVHRNKDTLYAAAHQNRRRSIRLWKTGPLAVQTELIQTGRPITRGRAPRGQLPCCLLASLRRLSPAFTTIRPSASAIGQCRPAPTGTRTGRVPENPAHSRAISRRSDKSDDQAGLSLARRSRLPHPLHAVVGKVSNTTLATVPRRACGAATTSLRFANGAVA
jgi:hypothetical protein